jgi:hypothetical protein
MLTIWDHDNRYRRRDFLKIGGFGLAGLASGSIAKADEKAVLTNKSVIFLFNKSKNNNILLFIYYIILYYVYIIRPLNKTIELFS